MKWETYFAAILISIAVVGTGRVISSALDRLSATNEKILDRLDVLADKTEVAYEDLGEIRKRLDDADEPPDQYSDGGSLYAIRSLLLQSTKY